MRQESRWSGRSSVRGLIKAQKRCQLEVECMHTKGGIYVPRPVPPGDPLATFFQLDEGQGVWRMWYLGQMGQGQIRDLYGDEISETTIVSELMLRTSSNEGGTS